MIIGKLCAFFNIVLVVICMHGDLNAHITIANQTGSVIQIYHEFQEAPVTVRLGESVSIPHNSFMVRYSLKNSQHAYDFNFNGSNFVDYTYYNIYSEITRSLPFSEGEDGNLFRALESVDNAFKLSASIFNNKKKPQLTLFCVEAARQVRLVKTLQFSVLEYEVLQQCAEIYALNEYSIHTCNNFNTRTNNRFQNLGQFDDGRLYYYAQIPSDKTDGVYEDAVIGLTMNDEPKDYKNSCIAAFLPDWFADKDGEELHTISQTLYKTDKYHSFPLDIVLRNLRYAQVKKVVYMDKCGLPIENYNGEDYYGLYIEYAIPGVWYNVANTCNKPGHNHGGNLHVEGRTGCAEVGFALGVNGRDSRWSLRVSHCAFISKEKKVDTCINPDTFDYDQNLFPLYRNQDGSFVIRNVFENPRTPHYINGHNTGMLGCERNNLIEFFPENEEQSLHQQEITEEKNDGLDTISLSSNSDDLYFDGISSIHGDLESPIFFDDIDDIDDIDFLDEEKVETSFVSVEHSDLNGYQSPSTVLDESDHSTQYVYSNNQSLSGSPLNFDENQENS